MRVRDWGYCSGFRVYGGLLYSGLGEVVMLGCKRSLVILHDFKISRVSEVKFEEDATEDGVNMRTSFRAGSWC